MMYAHDWYVWAVLAGVIILIGSMLRATMRQQVVMHKISHAKHRATVLHNYHWWKIVLRIFLYSLALVCLWLSVLRIRYEVPGTTPQYEQGRDLLIALDISRSMLAQDYAPNRLQSAKQKIKQLLRNLSSERVGLIVFSGSALVQCPLTKDFAAFELFLDALDAESMTHATTDLASALQAACTVFEQAQERKNKLLVIFTDGEDFSENLSAMQQKAQDLGMQVCAIGMATPEGAPMPEYDAAGVLQGHIRDEQGAIVMSRLNEVTLHKLAKQLSGFTVRGDQKGNADIERICAWVTSFEKETFAATDRANFQETFMYYAAAGLLLLLAGRCL